MATFNPYLNFKGNAEEAFNFYKTVFGGEFAYLVRFKDTPEADRLPGNEKEKIMHISLPVGEGTLLMATDALESMGHPLTVGNNFHILIDVKSKEEATKLYDALSSGGKIGTALSDTFWGAYFGSFTDKFGVQWMINYQKTIINRIHNERKIRPWRERTPISTSPATPRRHSFFTNPFSEENSAAAA